MNISSVIKQRIKFSWFPTKQKMLSFLLLFMIIIGFLYVIAGLTISSQTITPINIFLGLFVLTVLLTALLLNIKNYFLISATLFIISFSIVVFATAITNFLGMNPYYSVGDVNILVFLIFPVLLSGLLLSNKWTLTWSIIIGSSMLILPFIFSTVNSTDIILGPFSLFASISFLSILTSHYRVEMEKKKRMHILQSKREVEAMNQELTQAKKELKSINDHLEDLVGQRTEEIEQLIQQKNELINQLGHDLKNPLGPMINLLPILIKKEKDPKKLEILESLHRSTIYMKNLVVKTIKLAKLNSPNTEFNFEELNLNEEISEVINSNSLLFKEKNITLHNQIAENLLVEADKTQLQEVFNNLFNNAVKYSKDGGKVTVQAEELNQMIQVSIKDSGIGMTQEQINRIFDEYYKADSSRHDFDSSGLGMPICKRIVEKHGGEIWVESKGPGHGSTFYFTVPKAQTHILKNDDTKSKEYLLPPNNTSENINQIVHVSLKK